jgi:hypothetical protein
MRLDITLNGKLTHKNIPTSWDQVTYKQFLDLVDCVDDYVKAISVFTGVPSEVIRKAKILGLDDVIHVLGFLRQECPTRIPERLGLYPIPKNLGFETIAQYEDIQEEVKRSKELTPKEQLAKYPLYCAVYACKHLSIERCVALDEKFPNEGIVYGEYHWRKAEVMQEDFINCPVSEVLGIGNFTLLKLTALNLNINPSYRQPVTRMKKLKLVLKRWLLRSGLWELWITCQKKLGFQNVSY